MFLPFTIGEMILTAEAIMLGLAAIKCRVLGTEPNECVDPFLIFQFTSVVKRTRISRVGLKGLSVLPS